MDSKNKYLVIAGAIILTGIIAVGSFILGVYYVQQQQSAGNSQFTDNLQVEYTYDVTPSAQPVNTTIPSITCPTVNPTTQLTPPSAQVSNVY